MIYHNYIHIVFSKRRQKWAIGSWLIMTLDKFPASHVSVVFGYDLVLESVFPKSRAVSREKWSEHYEPVKIITLRLPRTYSNSEVIEIVKDYTNRPYSIWQLVEIGLGLFSRRLDRLIYKKTNDDSRTLICTELVMIVLNRVYKIGDVMKFDSYSLREVYREALKLSKGGSNG